MADTNETIADIIAEMRALSNPISDGIIAINGRSIADRLEAAHKREIETTAAKCCQLGRLAGYGASEIKHQQEPVGNAAKLRKALKKCLLYIACAESVGIGTITLNDKVKLDPKKITKSAKEALAATEKEGDNNGNE